MKNHVPSDMGSRNDWAGPLFYPPVGMVAVTKLGNRIEVYPDEGEVPGCFTGLLLREGHWSRRVVRDLSVFWDRSQIDHMEPPTDEDRRLAAI